MSTATDAPRTDAPLRSGVRADVLVAAGAVLLLVAAAAVPHLLTPDPRAELQQTFAPLLALWDPHVGPGTPLALLLAVATVAWGPGLAWRLRWRRLLAATYLLAAAWAVSLALVDGWSRGFTSKLTSADEYLAEIPRVTDVHQMLQGFTGLILDFQPQHWTTHVSAHPPGVFLLYVGLDRIGLGGGTWASIVTVAIGCSAPVAVLVAVRALAGVRGATPDGEQLARRAAPFLALAPAAVWVAVSADGMFTGVSAWGIALLALAATRTVPRPGLTAVGAGLLLGVSVYLSYGLVLIGFVALAVLVAARTWRPLVPAGLAALAVAGVFTALGFWWLEGYHLVVERYYQGIADRRTYSYWVWADLAALLCAVGVATPVGIRRALVPSRLRSREGLSLLVLGALLAVAAADVSGLSKAETERIWMPFGIWLLASTALLPRRHQRVWLALGAGLALAVNHLLLTQW